MSSYRFVVARPPVKSHPALLPVFPPLESALANRFSSIRQPKKPFGDPRFSLTTHVVPSNFLRSTAPATSPPPPPADPTASKDERRAVAQARLEWVKAQQAGERGRHERVLVNVVNRYVALKPQGHGRTVFLAHANGFPKEPAILDLLAKKGGDVDEIWAWEANHHGASFVANHAPFTACDWSDDARDILNFLLHFLPSEVLTELPLVLPPRSPDRKRFAQNSRLQQPQSIHPIMEPRLFTSLMLIDPVIIRSTDPSTPPGHPSRTEAALSRRESWPSRQAASDSFKSNPFFASWDPRVLEAYIEYGLVEGSDESVRLAMPALQEALNFEATSTSGAVWDLIPTIDPRIPLRWVVPGRPGEPEIGGPNSTQERVWLRPENASNVRISQAGHLVSPSLIIRHL
ncbi:AB hydrolase-1 domain-containing protein [Mycena indigotica]|uniref:AB hydrolase-1 domain-containing protein n=1 Tax=Mycena indigotica TaxID=2126181 RepID=A0A8H6VYD4_9AGAR|nr:AB hydrolase-1 domain-containing protein [Mycena indigotica]KAF7294783.1 AB hydrolase-1 domain-containing protein [Mycena indigotica]